MSYARDAQNRAMLPQGEWVTVGTVATVLQMDTDAAQKMLRNLKRRSWAINKPATGQWLIVPTKAQRATTQEAPNARVQ